MPLAPRVFRARLSGEPFCKFDLSLSPSSPPLSSRRIRRYTAYMWVCKLFPDTAIFFLDPSRLESTDNVAANGGSRDNGGERG